MALKKTLRQHGAQMTALGTAAVAGGSLMPAMNSTAEGVIVQQTNVHGYGPGVGVDANGNYMTGDDVHLPLTETNRLLETITIWLKMSGHNTNPHPNYRPNNLQLSVYEILPPNMRVNGQNMVILPGTGIGGSQTYVPGNALTPIGMTNVNDAAPAGAGPGIPFVTGGETYFAPGNPVKFDFTALGIVLPEYFAWGVHDASTNNNQPFVDGYGQAEPIMYLNVSSVGRFLGGYFDNGLATNFAYQGRSLRGVMNNFNGALNGNFVTGGYANFNFYPNHPDIITALPVPEPATAALAGAGAAMLIRRRRRGV